MRKNTKAYVPEENVIQMSSRYNLNSQGFDAVFYINENGIVTRIV